MSEEKKVSKVKFLQPWYTTLIQAAAAVGTVILFIIMFQQLQDIRHEQAVSLRPYIHLEIEPAFGVVQLTDWRSVGGQTEIWVLGYWLTNVGKYPAKNVFYKADWSNSSEIESPTKFDNNKPITVSPGMTMIATQKELARSEVLGVQDRGDRIYRHVYVKYQDGDGNEYYWKATWILSEYDVGSPIRWHLLTSEGT